MLVFLRVLDYYSGILFLTTNRPGVLDEAFKSRIHYNLNYPPLTKDQTLDIWALNIQRLRQISEQSKGKYPIEIEHEKILHFAGVQFDESERVGRWNGRQIRNAFQVVRSLAYYDALSGADQTTKMGPNGPVRTVVIGTKYFKIMHDITEAFDNYMLEIFNGQTDSDLALEMEHRADHFSSRSIHGAREDHDFRYQGHNGAGSPYNVGLRQDHADPRNSIGQRGGRLSVLGPGSAPQRYLPSSFAPAYTSGYDGTGIGDRNESPGKQRPAQMAERLTGDFIAASSLETEYSLEQNSHSGPRNSLSSGIPTSRAFGRNDGPYGPGREGRRLREFESDQEFRTERNEYGKRARGA